MRAALRGCALAALLIAPAFASDGHSDQAGGGRPSRSAAPHSKLSPDLADDILRRFAVRDPAKPESLDPKRIGRFRRAALTRRWACLQGEPVPKPAEIALIHFTAESADGVPRSNRPLALDLQPVSPARPIVEPEARLAQDMPAISGSASPRAVQLASLEPMPAPPRTNEEGPALALTLAAPLPQDALGIDLERLPLSTGREIKPVIAVAAALRARSGQAGLSQLREYGVPVEATYTPLYGTFRLAVTPVFLEAGRPSAAAAAGFGTVPLALAALPGVPLPTIRDQSAAGAALLLGYTYGPFSADLASTPLGFPVQNVLGGLAVSPRLFNDTVQLRLEARREPVTDSLLSYAGTRDPVSGATWGGVVQSGARVTVAYDDGWLGIYGAGGGALLDGEKVKENGLLDATFGAFFRPYDAHQRVVKLGINLTYMGYDSNLRFYSLGQGGYFSPQNYLNLSVPVEFSGRSGRLGFLASAAVGVQGFNERASPYFPNNRADQLLQASLGNATYPGRHEIGPSFNLTGQVEWALDQGLAIGAKATADNQRDYTEGLVKLYLRKTFDARATGPIFPEQRPSRW